MDSKKRPLGSPYMNGRTRVYWAEDVFVLINVVNTLLDDLKLADISSTGFVKYMFSELRWLQEQTQEISESVESFLRISPTHQLRFALENAIEQVTRQTEQAKHTTGQAALAILKEPDGLLRQRDHLETVIYSLNLSLHSLYEHLKNLERGREATVW